MTAFIIVTSIYLYLTITALFARAFYKHYQWSVATYSYQPEVLYSSREGRIFISFIFGVLWPLSWIPVIIGWNNTTAWERNKAALKEIKAQQDRITKLERDLGIR